MANLIQYVIVRGDLMKTLNWPLGALIAQCCHAATAVNHLYANDDETVEYFKDLDNMHKVVLDGQDQTTLEKLSETLKENEIKHKLWIEQPENIPTCIAIRPYPKDVVHKHVKKLKLLK
uniref:peptidyl-tRNA hydrolase n=1 Tax=Tabanus bromius TaxID=304241 RepID=A0A0K8TRA1_TABBR